jgi:hypothetical protein
VKTQATGVKGCHAELVEAWWAGLSARSFDKLRMTGMQIGNCLYRKAVIVVK